MLRYCVEKGSVAVDGVSLTVAALDDAGFAVALIPHTLDETTFGALAPGDARESRGRHAREVRRTAPPLYHESMSAHETAFATVEEAIEDIRQGKMVVVVDAADRENEGDLTIAAQFATPEAVNFMAKEGRGLICLCLTGERCDELGLRMMTEHNETPHGTAFTVSIEAREGISTGISAHDRARTIQVAIDPSKGPHDVVQPGHIFPLRAKPGGVLQRAGQTEAAIDLARLAGLNTAGVICEVMKDDGTMARVPDLIEFCAAHGLKLVTIADLIAYRRQHEKLVEREIAVRLPTVLRRVHGDAVPRDADGQAARRAREEATSTVQRTSSFASTPSASPATSSTR